MSNVFFSYAKHVVFYVSFCFYILLTCLLFEPSVARMIVLGLGKLKRFASQGVVNCTRVYCDFTTSILAADMISIDDLPLENEKKSNCACTIVAEHCYVTFLSMWLAYYHYGKLFFRR